MMHTHVDNHDKFTYSMFTNRIRQLISKTFSRLKDQNIVYIHEYVYISIPPHKKYIPNILHFVCRVPMSLKKVKLSHVSQLPQDISM